MGVALAVVAVAAFLMPQVLTAYSLTLATEILIAAVFAAGVNLLVGYTGLVSLGQAMFLGLGGYGIAIGSVLIGLPLWMSVIVTLSSVGGLAALIGAVCTRTKGVGFLLITLAFSQMAYGIAVKLRWTNGSDGMTGVPRPDLSGFGLSADEPSTFYFYVLVVAALVFAFMWRLVGSPFGSVLIGIRENESRLMAMGYRVTRYKIGSFAISGMICAVAGIMQAQYTYFINPDTMSWHMSGEAVLIAIIGGIKMLFGPLVGATFFVLVKHWLSQITEEYHLFFGLFFMLVVAFFRGGILGAVRGLMERAR